ARRAGIEGVVIVQTTIGTDGRLRGMRLLKGLSHGLDESTMETICTWRFEPATRDGEPVEVYYNLTVSFSLGGV
ncbi:MAG TPA: energy transducer TonB, partial [Thermoanaerobaculia bacterium]|nr:energy transducer TonB [Thermoanaerobaculia bacterium]